MKPLSPTLPDWEASLLNSAQEVQALSLTLPQWVEEGGPHSEIVFSTRIRLARNLAKHLFPSIASAAELTTVSDEICAAVSQAGVLTQPKFVEMDYLAQVDRLVLVERRLASPALADRKGSARIIIGAGEYASIMTNEEDHLRLQAFQSGLGVRAAWQMLERLDEELSNHLDYAFSPQLGYLTVCPTNTGTGMRVSLLVHLPALVILQEMEKVSKKFAKLGLTLRGFYGEGTEVIGNVFQISNQLTLGCSEEDTLGLLERVAEQLVNLERDARTRLLEDKSLNLEDKVWRTYGILRYARSLSAVEFLNFLSLIRLGLDLKILSGWTDAMLQELMLVTQPGHMQKWYKASRVTEKRDKLRADIVKNKLALNRH